MKMTKHKLLRLRAGVKQKDLAKALGVSQSWISDIESRDEFPERGKFSPVRYFLAIKRLAEKNGKNNGDKDDKSS